MPHADVQPVRMVYKLQKYKDIVPIIQGLTDAHKDNIGNFPAGIQLGKQHLIQQLRGCQVPDPACNGGGAKGTAHAAAHLGGNTDGVAMAVAHENRLNAVAVRQPPKIFYGSIQF